MTSRIPRPQISQENYNECSGAIQGKKVAGGVKRKALEPVVREDTLNGMSSIVKVYGVLW